MKINLRECFYVVAIVALALAWFVDRMQLKKQIEQTQTALLEHDQADIELLREIRTAIEEAGFKEIWTGDELHLRIISDPTVNSESAHE